jgi:hypothetical protein
MWPFFGGPSLLAEEKWVLERERFMGLGSVKAFSLKEARERARRSHQLLADGVDPIEHRLASRDLDAKQARERITFKQAAEQFLVVHDGKKQSPSLGLP